MKKYQFQVHPHNFDSPVRDTWIEACEDAVKSGHGLWVEEGIRLIHPADIVQLEDVSRVVVNGMWWGAAAAGIIVLLLVCRSSL